MNLKYKKREKILKRVRNINIRSEKWVQSLKKIR